MYIVYPQWKYFILQSVEANFGGKRYKEDCMYNLSFFNVYDVEQMTFKSLYPTWGFAKMIITESITKTDESSN